MKVFETTYPKYGTQVITVTIDSDTTDIVVVYTVTVVKVIPTHPHNNSTSTHQFSMEEGIPRWLTNRQIVPQDCIEENFINKIPYFNQFSTTIMRDMETRNFIEAYRKANQKVSAEERYERRTAFGSGQAGQCDYRKRSRS